MSADDRPLSPPALEERLEEHVDPVLSSRRTAAGPAAALARYSRSQQEFVLHWVGAISRSNAEMAFQVAAYAPQALDALDLEGVEAWIVQAMDAFDRQGLMAGIAALREVERFARDRRERVRGLPLEEVQGVLENFLHGLAGRPLRVEADEEAWTDTETIRLPRILGRFAARRDNFALYKAMAVLLWAQGFHGTWRSDPSERAAELPDPEHALALFHALETFRLEGRIREELPGVFRTMQVLRERLDEPLPAVWAEARAALSRAAADGEAVWRWVERLWGTRAPQCSYAGTLRPEAVREAVQARIAREKQAFRVMLAKLQEEVEGHPPGPEARQGRFSIREVAPAERAAGVGFELLLDGRPVPPPEGARGLMASIVQDLGEIPPDYLVAAGPGEYAAHQKTPERDPDAVWKGTYHEEGALLYNEWDHVRRHYRKNWCVLREKDVHPQHTDFVPRTLRKHRGLVHSLRRSFEALRGEDRILRRQPHGEDIDIDALVEAFGDLHCGMEMSDRIFTKVHRDERDIAVLFMVDMSGSTKGWINEAEREALVLLCEALETLGDRYAIYGFSGMTRKRCELYRIKRFDEPYDETVRARIAGIQPQDYTRMGVAIRHLTRLLTEVEARTKLLVTLSDGKPDDYTGYRGEYGIEDTRMALLEARRQGIHPFCITIDEQARDYLPHMYGAANYVVIDDVRRLPGKVSEIYRRLTS